MSKEDGFPVFNMEIKASVEEKEEKATFGNKTRKKFADISNLPKQARVSTLDERSHLMQIAMKEHIDQLRNENIALKTILAERNKIIEVTGTELQKMRVTLQKFQQQNLQLAQTNSQMLKDLNLGKDRLKALQHELGCKNGLLIVKKLETEERLKTKKCDKFDDEVELTNCEAAAPTKGSSKAGGDDGKCGHTRRPKVKSLGPRQVISKDEIENKRPCVRRQSARFRPEEIKPISDPVETEGTKLSTGSPGIEDDPPQENGSASASVSVQNEGIEQVSRHEAGKKRPCVRRQSARFKSEELKPSDDLSETVDANVAASVIQGGGREVKNAPGDTAVNKRPCIRRQSSRFKSEEPEPSDASVINEDDAFHKNDSIPTSLLVKNEDNEVHPAPGFETLESRRSSISRPSRHAAKRVQSYKEIPLNIKMRRDR